MSDISEQKRRFCHAQKLTDKDKGGKVFPEKLAQPRETGDSVIGRLLNRNR